MACIVNKPKLVTFIHNPKAAGISISRWMEINLGGKKLFPTHATANELKGELGWKFCVIRHPSTIILSRYKFLYKRSKVIVEYLKNDPLEWENIYEPFMPTEVQIAIKDGNLTSSNYNLEIQQEKFNYLAKGFLNYANTHEYVDQLQYSNYCDCVIKYENLQAEFKKVQKKLNCFRDLPHLNIGNVEIDIEDKAIDVINERYAEQSQALGYNIKSSN